MDNLSETLDLAKNTFTSSCRKFNEPVEILANVTEALAKEMREYDKIIDIPDKYIEDVRRKLKNLKN